MKENISKIIIINLSNSGLCRSGWPLGKTEKKKKNEKREKYLDLARELKKKLWNVKATVIPIVIGGLSKSAKGLVQGQENLEIRGLVETIQATALLRSARILRRVLKTWGDLLSLGLQWKTISWCRCEKLPRGNVIIIIIWFGVIPRILLLV